MKPVKRPWAKRRVHPGVTVGLLLLSVTSTALLWTLVLMPPDQPGVEIVPGKLPKKVVAVVEAAQNKEETEVNETEPVEVASPTYPITLSATEAASLSVVVNKKHKLPSDYIPATVSLRGATLRPEAAEAFDSFMDGAELDGFAPKAISSYRSYNTQVSVYNGYVAQNGQELADTFSARPGHSEHQTGLAVDVGNANGECDLEICFGSTGFGEWIKNNAHLYGFIVRYPEGKQALTGYQYEPWHLRYVGEEVATTIYSTGQTLDQHLGFPAGDY